MHILISQEIPTQGDAVNSVDTDRMVRLIDELDLEPIAFKLVHPESGETSMTIDEVDDLIEKYRRFLKLRAMYPEESIVPTKEIDKVWHVHILDTAKYAEDCESCFGYFLHHFPYFGMRGEADAAQLVKAGTETRELYKQHFGDDMSDGTEGGVEGECNCTGNCSPSCSPSGSADTTTITLKGVRPRLERV